jgi:hypothetical protein
MPDVPDLVLEQFRLGELTERDAERVRLLARTDPAVQLRIDALAVSDERLAARYPAGWMAGAIERRLATASIERSHARLAFRWSFPAVMAAAAIALIATIPREPAP